VIGVRHTDTVNAVASPNGGPQARRNYRTSQPGFRVAKRLHDHPAVDGQDLAGDVLCFWRSEKGNCSGDVFAFAEFA